MYHDVVEDCDWTFEDLNKEGIDEVGIEALVCLTRCESLHIEIAIREHDALWLAFFSACEGGV